jgi:hypothetical protein
MSEGTRPVVWISHKAAPCDACTIELSRGEFIAMDRARGIRCIKCARLDGLTFLPTGNAREAVLSRIERVFARWRGVAK